jgi:phosphotransferase system enzyme I (PtsI)
MRTFSGIGAADGIVVGKACVWRKRGVELRRTAATGVDVERELRRLSDAIEATTEELVSLRQQLQEKLGPDQASILDAQMLLLEDEELLRIVRQGIEQGGLSAEGAFARAMADALMPLDAAEDGIFRDRLVDFRDLEQRVLRELVGGQQALPQLTEPRILVARQLTPSETAALDLDKVLGFCTEEGGASSHTSIIARSLGVPAVVGSRGLLQAIEDGDELAVDGTLGRIHCEPTPELLRRCEARMRRWRGVEQRLRSLRDEAAVTTDGRRLGLMANVELPFEVAVALANGAQGIGLVRTEYFYFQRSRLPGEEEQFLAYRDVLERAGGRPVVFRVLDVGGDKLLSALGSLREDNPFLGWRGVRFLLSNRQILHGQLRALYRVSAHGPTKIMFPMITGLEELRELRAECLRCREELSAEGAAFDPHVALGIMVETPSAVALAQELAQEADFFSVGSNDLTQYLLAVDRTNPRVAHLFRSHHPAVLRAIRDTIAAGHAAGIEVALCGEMASNPLQAVLLVGLGIDELSVHAAGVPVIKKIIRSLSYAQARSWAEEALTLSTADEVERYLRARAHERLRDFLHE